MKLPLIVDLVFFAAALTCSSIIILELTGPPKRSKSTGLSGQVMISLFANFLWFALASYFSLPSEISGYQGPRSPIFPIFFLLGSALTSICILSAKPIRRVALKLPLSSLVQLQSTRLIGAYFLVMALQNRASPGFAIIAGIGDVLVGVTALAAARLIKRYPHRAGQLALAHCALGLADFAVAITTAFRFGTGLDWPAPLIPLWLVPLATALHVVTIASVLRRDHIKNRLLDL